MKKRSPEEELRKRAVFDGMTSRRQKKILERGYDRWDPFEPPRDPIDLRRGKERESTAVLVREFLTSHAPEKHTQEYSKGVWEICTGLMGDSDRYRGMYEFACWYRAFLRGKKLGEEGEDGDD